MLYLPITQKRPSLPAWFIILTLAMIGWVWGGVPALVMAQDKEITIEKRICDVTILPNGDVQVEETWDVIFRKGRFSRVMHEISHDHITGITGWEVQSSGVHYKESANEDSINYEEHTYTVREGEKSTTITWYFPKTQNRTRTFTLKYTLQGAMQIYPDGNDSLSWQTIERNHGYPVIAAEVVVHLPNTYEPSKVQGASYRNDKQDSTSSTIADDGQTVSFTGGPFDAGTTWMIRVQFPHSLAQTVPPAWQTAAEHAFNDPTNTAQVQRRDYDLTIAPTGEIQVVETWELDLAGGPFSNASWCMPHKRLTSISAWAVSEQDTRYEQADSQQPHTFTVETKEAADLTQTCVTWYFPVTTNERRIFTIGYTVQGGMWIADDADMLMWDISDYNHTYTINESQTTVHLPTTFDPDQINAVMTCDPTDVDHTIDVTEDGVTVHGGAFVPDVACNLEVQFPHGNITAAAPPWQQVEDVQLQQTKQAQQQQALTGLLLKVAAGVVGVVVLVGVIRLWRNMPK